MPDISLVAGAGMFFAIITGNGLLDNSLLAETPEFKPPRGQNAIYAFALP